MKLEHPPIKVLFIEPHCFRIGVTRSEVSGVRACVYDRERTICDVIRHAAKLDVETVNKAIQAYVRDGRKNITRPKDELSEVRANAFAAAFLMPEDGIRDYVSRLNKGLPSRPRQAVVPLEGDVQFVEGRLGPEATKIGLWHVCLLAGHFRVSRLAMIWPLFNLKLITERERTRLLAADQDGSGRMLSRMLGIDAEVQCEGAAEAGEGQVVRPTGLRLARRRLIHLALEAVQHEVISRRKFQELVRLGDFDPDELGATLERIKPPTGPSGSESEG